MFICLVGSPFYKPCNGQILALGLCIGEPIFVLCFSDLSQFSNNENLIAGLENEAFFMGTKSV